MPEVRNQVSLGRKAGRMGRTPSSFTAALPLPSTTSIISQKDRRPDLRQQTSAGMRLEAHKSTATAIFTGKLGDYLKQFNEETIADRRRDTGQLRDGEREPGGHGRRGSGVPLGVKKRLKSEWNKTAKAYQAELGAIDRQRQERHHQHFKADILELYAGQGKISQMASHYGLVPHGALGNRDGHGPDQRGRQGFGGLPAVRDDASVRHRRLQVYQLVHLQQKPQLRSPTSRATTITRSRTTAPTATMQMDGQDCSWWRILST